MAIIGWVGLIGSGKTFSAVKYAVALAKRRNAYLASNIHVAEDVPYAQWVSMVPRPKRVQLSIGEHGFDLDEVQGLVDLAREEGVGVVWFIDEIGILMPARFWQSFPIDLMYMLSQSRKFKVDLLYTAQDVEDVDSYLRRKTSYVFRVRAIPTSTIDREERGKRPWFFLETKWRPTQVGKRDKRLGWHLSRYDRSVEGLYDTDELVRPAARVAQRGRTRGGEAATGATSWE